MCLSSVCFAVMGLCIKELRQTLPAGEVVFFRSVISLVVAVVSVWVTGQRFFGTRPWLLLARGIFGCVALLGYTIALGLIPYAEAAALLYTSPVFTALFAAMFLRERITGLTVIAIVGCLSGSVLILSPEFSAAHQESLTGGLWALLAGVFSGLAYTSVRALSKSEGDQTIVLWFALVGVPLGYLWSMSEFRAPQGLDWVWIAVMGVTAQAGQVFLTRAFRRSEAGAASVGTFVVLLLAAMTGLLVYDEVPTLPAVAGGMLIVASIVMLSARTR